MNVIEAQAPQNQHQAFLAELSKDTGVNWKAPKRVLSRAKQLANEGGFLDGEKGKMLSEDDFISDFRKHSTVMVFQTPIGENFVHVVAPKLKNRNDKKPVNVAEYFAPSGTAQHHKDMMELRGISWARDQGLMADDEADRQATRIAVWGRFPDEVLTVEEARERLLDRREIDKWSGRTVRARTERAGTDGKVVSDSGLSVGKRAALTYGPMAVAVAGAINRVEKMPRWMKAASVIVAGVQVAGCVLVPQEVNTVEATKQPVDEPTIASPTEPQPTQEAVIEGGFPEVKMFEELGFETKKDGEDWLLFDGDNQMGQLIQKDEQSFLEIVIDEKIYEVNVDENKVFEHEKGAAVADLDEKTASGYELGAVWREGEWREIMLDYRLGTDRRDFEGMPVIGYEDFTSGRLTETEKLLAEPLSDEIEVVEKYKGGIGEFVAGFIKEKIDYYRENPDKYPLQPRFFSKVEINGVETVMITWQIKDKSGKDKFLHMVEVLDGLLDEESGFFHGYLAMISLGRPPAFNLVNYGSGSCNVFSGEWPAFEQVVCPINRPKKDELSELKEKLLESGSIPEELETELFVRSSVDWGGTIILE